MMIGARAIRTAIATLTLFLGTAILRADEPADSSALLDQAVKELGDAQFFIREKAMRTLWEQGMRAKPHLEAALMSPDLDVKLRAQRVLEAVELGIGPDTPAALVAQIFAFRDGSLKEKEDLVRSLAQNKDLALAQRLIETIDNGQVRRNLTSIVSAKVRALVIPLLLEGQLDEAKEKLAWAAQEDSGMRDYAVFLHLTGQLDDEITQWKAKGGLLGNRARQLGWFLRVQGDLEEASKLGDAEWALEIRAAQGDPLAVCEGHLAQRDLTEIERMGLEASHARLRGDAPGVKKAVQAIIQWTEIHNEPWEKWGAAEALLLTDEVEAALPIIPYYSNNTRYDLQTYRGVYGDGLKDD